jgi:hypothetical protein
MPAMNTNRSRRLLAITLGLGLIALISGCSGFDQQWKDVAGRAERVGPEPGLDGAWIGWWHSDAGHGGGELRCLLSTAYTGAPDDYRAWFKARFWGILTGEHMTMIRGQRQGDTVVFSGNEDMGPLAGGDYRYRGRIDPDEFRANYRSDDDHGTFQLERVK